MYIYDLPPELRTIRFQRMVRVSFDNMIEAARWDNDDLAEVAAEREHLRVLKSQVLPVNTPEAWGARVKVNPARPADTASIETALEKAATMVLTVEDFANIDPALFADITTEGRGYCMMYPIHTLRYPVYPSAAVSLD